MHPSLMPYVSFWIVRFPPTGRQMTTAYDKPPKPLRSIEEVVAEFTADVQRLGLTDPRRSKLSAWIEVLEGHIACRGHRERTAPQEG
jgi:hypothetical protein